MRLVFALLLLSLNVQLPGPKGNNQPKASNPRRQGNAEAANQPSIPLSLEKSSPPVAAKEAQNQQQSSPPGPAPFMSHAEWIMSGLTALYVGLTLVYVLYSRQTLKELQRQIGLIEKQHIATQKQIDVSQMSADAALLNAKAVINSERPFILVYTKGDLGTELWIRNCGRSPAQLLQITPVLKYAYPRLNHTDQDWVLPEPPFYGKHYERGEQLNVAWLAPGERRRFSFVNPSIFEELPSEMIAELNQGLRTIRIYSAIKYRGIITTDTFETRFCYGWDKDRGTYMVGPYGYNKNS